MIDQLSYHTGQLWPLFLVSCSPNKKKDIHYLKPLERSNPWYSGLLRLYPTKLLYRLVLRLRCTRGWHSLTNYIPVPYVSKTTRYGARIVRAAFGKCDVCHKEV